jgi:hypothetical protein
MLAFMGATSVLVINAAYGFEGSWRRLDDYQFQSKLLTHDETHDGSGKSSGNRFSGSWLGSVPVPFPQNYLQGLDTQRLDFERKRRSFLRGEWRAGGWWYFYLYALAVKSPLGTWALVLLGIMVTTAARPHVAASRHELVLLIPALGIFGLVSSQTAFSIHPRYVLPVLPFLFVWLSKVARSFAMRDARIAFPVALAACASTVSSLWTYPHSLSYFNELAGGPRFGHAHLVSSAVAWGQDLFFLRSWLHTHPEAQPLHLVSLGYVDPRLLGLEFKLPPVGPTRKHVSPKSRQDALGPHAGWYAIDVNYLAGGSEPLPDGNGGQYVPRGDGFDFGYFRHFEPIASAGYSIRLFRITAEQANAIRRELGLWALTDSAIKEEVSSKGDAVAKR